MNKKNMRRMSILVTAQTAKKSGTTGGYVRLL